MQGGIYKNLVWCIMSKNEKRSMFQYGWNKITKLTIEGRNTADLQDVFLAAFAEEIVVSREDGTVKLTPRIEDAFGYIREFCKNLGDDKLIFAVDSYQPLVNFDKIFARPVEHLIWGENGDPLRTDHQQMILCDTAHLGCTGLFKR